MGHNVYSRNKNKMFKIIEVFSSHSRRHVVEIVVQLHSFVTTALFGGTNVIGGWVSITSGLQVLRRETFLGLSGNFFPNTKGHNYLLPFVG